MSVEQFQVRYLQVIDADIVLVGIVKAELDAVSKIFYLLVKRMDVPLVARDFGVRARGCCHRVEQHVVPAKDCLPGSMALHNLTDSTFINSHFSQDACHRHRVPLD